MPGHFVKGCHEFWDEFSGISSFRAMKTATSFGEKFYDAAMGVKYDVSCDAR